MSSVAAGSHPAHKDYEGSKLGMWLFLFTEILLFGGLFLLYSAYRAKYPQDFHIAGQHLNMVIGVVNTVILLTSSLTVAVAITAIQKGNRKLTLLCLTATIALRHRFPGKQVLRVERRDPPRHLSQRAGAAEAPDGEKIFYGLYYSMTGLHGLHVVAGIILLSIVLDLVRRQRVSSTDFNKLENAGLYWHLVDVIWIFLLPLLYLAA